MSDIKFENLILNDTYLRVLYWFFSYPNKEISLSDLAKSVNLSKTTTNIVVKYLEKKGFLKIEDLGRLWRISLVQNHYFNYTKKISYNLDLIFSSEIIEHILSEYPLSRSIILFGSYRKGDDTELSDIDIAVEVLDDLEISISQLKIISKLGYRKNVKVNLLKFNRNKIDLNLFSNIANGIVLYGFLEVKP